MSRPLLLSVVLSLVSWAPLPAAEVVLPQSRNAYYANESIDLAVAGLPKGERAQVELTPPQGSGLSPCKFDLEGDGGTVTVQLPPLALAPGVYAIRLGGQETPEKLTIVTGIPDSTMLFSQTGRLEEVREVGGNF